jgi:hypothetical protein
MADLTKPIDITLVNDTAKRYLKELKSLEKLAAAEVLQHFTPMLGIQDSLVITYIEHKNISGKYTGEFKGDKQIGIAVPRTLVVKPCVAEMADEPERYRRSYITAIAGGLEVNKHPFEKWLLQYGIEVASEELVDAIYQAKYDADVAKVSLMDAFDGIGTIIAAEIAKADAEGLKLVNKNLFDFNVVVDKTNIGDVLLAQYRSAHTTMKRKGSVMIISEDMGEMYDDWYKANHDRLPNLDTAGQQFLEGTNKKCQLIRWTNINDGKVILTRKKNLVFGVDKLSDMKSMKAFNSGNPYMFTAAMKYVFGVQFASINHRELIIGTTLEGEVTFTVTNGGAATVGANVNFNGEDILTDAEGVAVFSNVLYGTDLAYTITKATFVDAEGTVDVAEGAADVAEAVALVAE